MNFFNNKRHKLQFLGFFLMFVFFISLSSAQTCINEIDKDRVIQKRKKKFIYNKYLQNINSFDDLIPTCTEDIDSSAYSYQYATYYIKEDINKIWKTYKNISLSDSYTGEIVSFGFMYSKNIKDLFYIDSENFEGIKEGQVYFINLDLLAGLKRLVVAYEVTDVDEENKTIQFCYIKCGVSEGTQRIILSETEEGYTKIQHNTIYKSQSKIRDRFIYPGFHKKIVKELHKNLMVYLH